MRAGLPDGLTRQRKSAELYAGLSADKKAFTSGCSSRTHRAGDAGLDKSGGQYKINQDILNSRGAGRDFTFRTKPLQPPVDRLTNAVGGLQPSSEVYS